MATRADYSSLDDDRRPSATPQCSTHSQSSGFTLNAADSDHDMAAMDDIDQRRSEDFSSTAYVSVPTEEPRKSCSAHPEDAAKPEDRETNGATVSYKPLGNLEVLWLWKYEVLAIIVSILAFISMVILLNVSDGKPQPQFAYSINLTTTIAIFTTLLRAAMLYIVAEGENIVGQSKWVWMESPRPLRHIEHFDNAGRGLWGSLKLLFVAIKSRLTILISLIVITSYAIGPFVQQGVKTYPCAIDGKGIARIAIAERVVRSDVNIMQQHSYGDVAVAKNIRTGPELQMVALTGLLSSSPAGAGTVNLLQCDSGNCSFPLRGPGVTHTSLGLCSTCTDVRSKVLESRHISNASHVMEKDRDYQFNSHSDFRISTYLKLGIFNMTTERTYGSLKDKVENAEISILSFTAKGCGRSKDHAGLTRTCEHDYDNMPILRPDFDIVAANCSLRPCLRRYHANVSNGVLKEELVSTSPVSPVNMSYVQANVADEVRNTFVYRNFSYVTMVEPCIISDVWYDWSNISQAPRDGVDWTSWDTGDTLYNAPSKCLLSMDPGELFGIRRFLIETLKGSCSKGTGGSNRPDFSLESGRIVCQGGFWVDALFNNGNATFDDISTAFGSMATALTNRMRARGQMSICIRVDWPWLLYPGILLVLTSILLAATYAQSCRDRGRRPIWKSSILPLLFYGAETQQRYLDKQRDSSDASRGIPLLQLTELESIADTTKVQFCSGRDVAGFIVDKTSPEAA
ncbi:hypothetical protein CcaCcLH18_04597 [Colletotrichum camelliae]|nr:hypothetical protein CcaCcLH18_04597 [Colletotrichum camelliae]